MQLPELGLLSLAMLVPIISGGLNLSVTFTANMAGLTTAWLVQGLLAGLGILSVPMAIMVGLLVGASAGFLIGFIVAYVGAHPILVSLGAMIFLQGVGEFLTRGGGISGMPEVFQTIGSGSLLGVPIPMLIFLAAAAGLMYVMHFTRTGFSIYMLGSNPRATEYSGINVKRVLMTVYTLSGLLAGLAGMVMLARFNSVRVGHGELLTDYRAGLFSSRGEPVWRLWPRTATGTGLNEPAGDRLWYEPDGRQPASSHRRMGCFSNYCDGTAYAVYQTVVSKVFHESSRTCSGYRYRHWQRAGGHFHA